eukprot:3414413-Pleurochrysis_carterae.AAC.1
MAQVSPPMTSVHCLVGMAAKNRVPSVATTTACRNRAQTTMMRNRSRAQPLMVRKWSQTLAAMHLV